MELKFKLVNQSLLLAENFEKEQHINVFISAANLDRGRSDWFLLYCLRPWVNLQLHSAAMPLCGQREWLSKHAYSVTKQATSAIVGSCLEDTSHLIHRYTPYAFFDVSQEGISCSIFCTFNAFNRIIQALAGPH
jgi:hypothetical protein